MSKYWLGRAKQIEKEAMRNADKATPLLQGFYRDLYQEIKKDMLVLRNKIESYAQAGVKLDREEVYTWNKTLEEYVDIIKKAPVEIQPYLKAELEVKSLTSRKSRLDLLMLQIEKHLTNCTIDSEHVITDCLTDTIQGTYKLKIADLRGVKTSFAVVDDKKVRDILSIKWSGENYSARLWDNRNKLAKKSREIITKGLIQGKSPSSMALDLQGCVEGGYNEAIRLVRTETNFVQNHTILECYKEEDIQEYEILAIEDSRTSQVCKNLDGKIFRVEEAKAGINYPPFHPNCRTTTVELASRQKL